ncbi:MAG: NADH-quinone oxidoreductase subunit C [Chloroflexi bacterium]|nr:NADH-quinone oxidoreductase subunit C [Chloroflexota bacterium]
MKASFDKGLVLQEVLSSIRSDLGERVVKLTVGAGDIVDLEIGREDLLGVAFYLRDNPKLSFNYLSSVSGVDRLDRIEVVYHMHSLSSHLTLCLRARLNVDNPVVDSLTPVWAGANWHEREAYDLFGIKFSGHPDLRRIMLEDDFDGHPLRKSYRLPRGRAT